MQSRKERLLHISNNPEISVLIVGAGINGIGTFRDLALQGVDVLLVDRGDYCSGASAASSHMVHGGIRYLENGEFRLVREAVQERNRLIENASHLVKPLPTTFPIFKWFSGLFNAPLKFLGLLDRPAERGAVVIKIGMLLYDFYTRKQRTVSKHVFWKRKRSLAMFPALNPEVLFTGTYYDGSMLAPERIAVELILDAVDANEAAIPLNYVSLKSAQGDLVILRDEITGEKYHVKPKVLINAGGPWIDLVNRNMGKDTRFIGGTKGSHIILDHPELRKAIGEHEFFFENSDGRIVLIFPMMDRVMIGTSDIRTDDPDDVVVTEEEIDYFFELVNRVFPDIKVDRSQIVFTFSGVRPLPYSGSKVTGQISRDHKIEIIDSNSSTSFPIYSLIGGKWTSFRAFSEQAADKTLGFLGKQRRIFTTDIKIGGGKDHPKTQSDRDKWIGEISSEINLDQERLLLLLDRYGTRAKEIAKFIVQEKDHPLEHLPDYSRREIEYLIRVEDVNHLDDLILRRTMIAKLGRLTQELLVDLAIISGKVLGWSETDNKQEIKRTVNILETMHKISFNQFIDNTGS